MRRIARIFVALFADMNNVAKLAIAAGAVAVVAVVAVVGTKLLWPSHSATPRPSPPPTPAGVSVVVPVGSLSIGRHSLTVEGVPLSFSVSTSTSDGWVRYGSLYIGKSTVGPQGAEAVIFWTSFPDGVYAYPCAQLLLLDAPIGPSAADLAAVVSTARGTELVTGPSDVTVGGRPAKHVVLTVREDVGCDPGYFFAWQQVWGGPFWASTELGDTIRVWIVDVDGTLLFIEAETTKQAGSDLEQEIQQIVESISFD
jgi:hypothetical protein